jgi:hypothetical protein
MLLPEYEEVVLHMKQFRQDYNDYWLSTAGNTKTGGLEDEEERG